MSSKCDNHNRIRVLPSVWKSLLSHKKKASYLGSIPSLANSAMEIGISLLTGEKHISCWVSTSKRHPADGERVIATYSGVYEHRLVTFWRDGAGNAHYGKPNELDGKGSQPATHWYALPNSPK